MNLNPCSQTLMLFALSSFSLASAALRSFMMNHVTNGHRIVLQASEAGVRGRTNVVQKKSASRGVVLSANNKRVLCSHTVYVCMCVCVYVCVAHLQTTKHTANAAAQNILRFGNASASPWTPKSSSKFARTTSTVVLISLTPM